MKILYVWHAAVEREFRKVLYEMVNQGHEVSLITAHRWTESSTDQKWIDDVYAPVGFRAFPIRVIFRNHIRSFFFLSVLKLIRLFLKISPDVIYLKEEPYSVAAYQITFLARIFLPKVKIIVESDENLDIKHPLFYRWLEKQTFGRINAIASVPTVGLDLYRKRGFGGKQFKTSYFVNDSIFHPVQETHEFFPEIDGKHLKFGYVGRITEEKGLDTFLEAISNLKRKNIKFKAYFLGKIAEEYRDSFETMIKDLRIQEEVILLSARPMQHLVYFYNAIDVLVLPSRSTDWWVEQFGRVIVESHACGTPVVGSNSGEIPIVIDDERFVFQEGSSEELIGILEKFLSGEWRKIDLSDSLITKVLQRFSISQVAKQKVDMMKALVEEKA